MANPKFAKLDAETDKLSKLYVKLARKVLDKAGLSPHDEHQVLIKSLLESTVASMAAYKMPAQLAVQVSLSALAHAYGAKCDIIEVDAKVGDSESPHTFGGKPIIGHC